MPGYLTSMAVLIEADRWLEKVENALNAKVSRSELDKTVLTLASSVRKDYLRFEYKVGSEGMPPHSKTKIDNKVGDGLSRYAFAGALGPDFPAAGNILGMNQRWVSDTMHNGSSRRAWRNARTTEFVLYSPNNVNGIVRNPSNEVFNDTYRLYTTLRIGHVASIASHVIIQPFINQWAWANAGELSTWQEIAPWPLANRIKPGNPIKFSVQLDAKLAQGYFQRDNLHSGPWTDYLPDEDRAIDFICEIYRENFHATYGTDRPIRTPDQANAAAIRPKERTCDVPTLADLTKSFPALADVVKKYPKVAAKIGHWMGWPMGTLDFSYDDLFTEDDKDVATAEKQEEAKKQLAEINAAVDKIDGLKSILTDYPCSTPKLDLDFLRDGYKNTKNWALGSGYNWSRPWIIGLFMTVGIPFMSVNPIRAADDADGAVKTILGILGFGVTVNVWSNTIAFGGSDPEVTAIRDENRNAWIKDGLGQEIIWFDIFASSDGASSIPLFFYGFFLTGFLFFDGIFGQNAGALAGLPRYHGRQLYKLVNGILIPFVVMPIISSAAVAFYRQPGARWTIFFVQQLLTVLEQFWITAPDPALGRQGDAFGRRVWYLKLWLTSSFILSSALAFGVKAGDSRENPARDPDLRDYLLGLVFPLVVVAAIVWGRSGFEAAMVEALIGVEWPDNSTDLVDGLVPIAEKEVEVDGKKSKVKFLRDDGENLQKVAVFETVKLKAGEDISIDGAARPNLYYPEADPSTKWDDLPDADEKARRDGRKESPNPYRFKHLFDRAAIFAGLLAMAVVNTEQGDVDKSLASAIFKDWNLDYRAEDEWNELMETRPDGTPGLLNAAQQWSDSLLGIAKTPLDPAAVVQLEIAMGLRPGPAMISGRIEDRSVAPNNSRPDTAHVFLANTAYEIVDGTGKVMASGKTDSTGAFEMSLPGPADYELRVAGFQGIG